MPTLIDDYFVSDDIFPADLAIVFGMTTWRRPCARAVELYRDGMARKLLFTGGFNRTIQAVEAEEMARGADAAGVPQSDIIIEAEAANTVENVTNARRCIEQSLGIDNIRSVLLVAIHFHMRRVKVIVERTFPRHIHVGCASYPSAFYDSLDWSQSERGRADVASEARKLEAYF
jgi:uncharacterized SAM-binding protein YcdF (DUF218 family)